MAVIPHTRERPRMLAFQGTLKPYDCLLFRSHGQRRRRCEKTRLPKPEIHSYISCFYLGRLICLPGAIVCGGVLDSLHELMALVSLRLGCPYSYAAYYGVTGWTGIVYSVPLTTSRLVPAIAVLRKGAGLPKKPAVYNRRLLYH